MHILQHFDRRRRQRSIESTLRQALGHPDLRFSWRKPRYRTARRKLMATLTKAGVPRFTLLCAETPFGAVYLKRAVAACQAMDRIADGSPIRFPKVEWQGTVDGRSCLVLEQCQGGVIEQPHQLEVAVEALIRKDRATLDSVSLDLPTRKRIERGFRECWAHAPTEIPADFLDHLPAGMPIKLCFEHGDFAKNNVLCTPSNEIIALDWEFYRTDQPLMFDFFHLIGTYLGHDDNLLATLQSDPFLATQLTKYIEALDIDEAQATCYYTLFEHKIALVHRINAHCDQHYA